MQAHRIKTTVQPDRSVTLEKLPFTAGQPVEVTVLPIQVPPAVKDRYPLRGMPIQYSDPTEPVAETEWEAAR